MKQSEIVIGAKAFTRVAGTMCEVEILAENLSSGRSPRFPDSKRIRKYKVKNLRTGNVLLRTAAALHKTPNPLGERVKQWSDQLQSHDVKTAIHSGSSIGVEIERHLWKDSKK